MPSVGHRAAEEVEATVMALNTGRPPGVDQSGLGRAGLRAAGGEGRRVRWLPLPHGGKGLTFCPCIRTPRGGLRLGNAMPSSIPLLL